jgi:hypothetical protein
MGFTSFPTYFHANKYDRKAVQMPSDNTQKSPFSFLSADGPEDTTYLMQFRETSPFYTRRHATGRPEHDRGTVSQA